MRGEGRGERWRSWRRVGRGRKRCSGRGEIQGGGVMGGGGGVDIAGGAQCWSGGGGGGGRQTM